jgi:hypothetical protein
MIGDCFRSLTRTGPAVRLSHDPRQRLGLLITERSKRRQTVEKQLEFFKPKVFRNPQWKSRAK